MFKHFYTIIHWKRSLWTCRLNGPALVIGLIKRLVYYKRKVNQEFLGFFFKVGKNKKERNNCPRKLKRQSPDILLWSQDFRDDQQIL